MTDDMTWEGRTGVSEDDLREWMPDLCAGLVVLALGLVETVQGPGFTRFDGEGGLIVPLWTYCFPVAVAAAVTTARHLPGPTLAGCWALAVLQLATGHQITTTELSLAWVSFSCARWGSTPTLVTSGLSGPLVALLLGASSLVSPLLGTGVLLGRLVNGLGGTEVVLALVVAVVGSVLSLVPWLVGLLLRSRSREQASARGEERATAQVAASYEVARLQEQHARLARDVHDVVGHSLTVILSQAEAAQYLPDDPAQLKETLATIAGSARTSLLDVRQVLGATQASAPDVDVLSQVIEAARHSGVEVRDSVEGVPQPLPPELAEVARRVLQEMLTNAFRHGDRTQPVVVERHWEGELRVEVTNACPDEEATVVLGSGSGIDGMRQRLEAVGGRLDVRRRSGSPATFTATAWVPVRPR
jgi:signal transduction histidine kinase